MHEDLTHDGVERSETQGSHQHLCYEHPDTGNLVYVYPYETKRIRSLEKRGYEEVYRD